MSAELVIIGGGEHTCVVYDAAQADFVFVGLVDPTPAEVTLQRTGLRCLGNDEQYLRALNPTHLHVLSVRVRPRDQSRQVVAQRYDAYQVKWATIVHPRAWVSPSAVLDPGVVVLAGAVINSGARIGRHTIINSSALIEHDVHVGAFASIAPAAAIGGGTEIGEGTYVGLGARVRDHIQVGANALIGMGAAVIRSVDAGVTVQGVPARRTT